MYAKVLSLSSRFEAPRRSEPCRLWAPMLIVLCAASWGAVIGTATLLVDLL